MNLVWWPGREAPVEVEVGGTWLAAAAQRTPINTEAKVLLLRHAFEVWQVGRVAICTDARNDRSRNAIERIGATFEGVLRRHRPATGHLSTAQHAARLGDVLDHRRGVAARARSAASAADGMKVRRSGRGARER